MTGSEHTLGRLFLWRCERWIGGGKRVEASRLVKEVPGTFHVRVVHNSTGTMRIKSELRDIVVVISRYRLGVGDGEKRDFKMMLKLSLGLGADW